MAGNQAIRQKPDTRINTHRSQPALFVAHVYITIEDVSTTSSAGRTLIPVDGTITRIMGTPSAATGTAASVIQVDVNTTATATFNHPQAQGADTLTDNDNLSIPVSNGDVLNFTSGGQSSTACRVDYTIEISRS